MERFEIYNHLFMTFFTIGYTGSKFFIPLTGDEFIKNTSLLYYVM